MFSFEPQSRHHFGHDSEPPAWQMGQPAGAVIQRQQTDNLPSGRSDAHGVERELQFADLEYPQTQAMG